MSKRPYDVVVIGAGIVGLATARELLGRYPGLRLVVLEKDRAHRRRADRAQQRGDARRDLL